LKQSIEIGSSLLKLFKIKLVTFLRHAVLQSWTWIGSIHGLDWIGLGPMTAILCFFHLYIFYINN